MPALITRIAYTIDETINPDLKTFFHPYTPFHSIHWFSVLHSSYGYQPLLFYRKKLHNKITSFLPVLEVKSIITGKRGITLPFTDFFEPHLIEDNLFIEDIIKIGKARGWDYFEIRYPFNIDGVVYDQHYYHHHLVLNPDTSGLYNQIRPSFKRNIKKAYNLEMKVEFRKDLPALKIFYQLHCLTRKRKGTPAQPFRFFKNIFKKIINCGKGILALAQCGKKYIAANVFLFENDYVLYKFGASNPYSHKSGANHFLMWESIKYFSKLNYKYFSFGRTSPDNHGLLFFKRGWGSIQQIIPYSRFYFKKQKSNIPKIGKGLKKIFRVSPLWLLRIFSWFFYRHMA